MKKLLLMSSLLCFASPSSFAFMPGVDCGGVCATWHEQIAQLKVLNDQLNQAHEIKNFSEGQLVELKSIYSSLEGDFDFENLLDTVDKLEKVLDDVADQQQLIGDKVLTTEKGQELREKLEARYGKEWVEKNVGTKEFEEARLLEAKIESANKSLGSETQELFKEQLSNLNDTVKSTTTSKEATDAQSAVMLDLLQEMRSLKNKQIEQEQNEAIRQAEQLALEISINEREAKMMEKIFNSDSDSLSPFLD